MQKKDKYVVAIVGATGLVGRELIKLLEIKDMPSTPFSISKLYLLANTSAGTKLPFRGEDVEVQKLNDFHFGEAGVDFAFFSAGSDVSRIHAIRACEENKKCIVIDNTSYFRMDPNYPLLIPEVNMHHLFFSFNGHSIIANPNCSTIQVSLPIKALLDKVGIKKVFASTYQAVSGAGNAALEALYLQLGQMLNKQPISCNKFPVQIAGNAIPHIGDFEKNRYTKEEEKMKNELRKILNLPKLIVSATCVRIPVFNGHSVALTIETENYIPAKSVRQILNEFPGIKVVDDLSASSKEKYATAATHTENSGDVFVSRIRNADGNFIEMWVVSNNLWKGAALNAVQIAEYMVEKAHKN